MSCGGGVSKAEHRESKREHRLPKAEHEVPAVGGSPSGSKKGARGGRLAPRSTDPHGSEPKASDAHATASTLPLPPTAAATIRSSVRSAPESRARIVPS